jgi:micrococcal nuclease
MLDAEELMESMDSIKPPLPDEDLFEYRAWMSKKYDGVYDGDTIYVEIDFGMYSGRRQQAIRLIDVHTPEIRGAERQEGLKVEKWLQSKLLPGEEVRIRTQKDKQSFTRWLGYVWRKDKDGNWILINQEIIAWMIDNGMDPNEYS